MAETLPTFVARRKPEWDRLTALVQQVVAKSVPLRELSELDRLYRRAAADLAHAQTFYRGTDVERFLNQLTAKAYGTIYRTPKHRLAALRRFFTHVFPQTLRAERRYVLLSAAVMGLGFVLGGSTILFEPQMASVLVPDHLQRFVADKRLWTDDVLNATPPQELATQILTNNLRVTVSAFALGITLGLGTLAVLLFNGLQLGAVLAFCFRGGVGPGLLTFIAAHGPVELSVIAIAGAAGLIVGHALIEPGERPRAEVLRERAAQAVKLVLGCAPFLALIGVVEGFISPGHLFPWWAKVMLGVATGSAFWLYLVTAGRQRTPAD